MVVAVSISAVSDATVALQPAVQSPVQGVPSMDRVDAFQDAMARQGVVPGLRSVGIADVKPGGIAEPSTVNLDAESRARRGLGLDGQDGKTAAVPSEGGDVILGGLQKLRSIFDTREARLNEVMNATTIDSRSLMAMQMEMTNFTMLVDISSKLTGKSTQAFETLMKGQ